MVIANFINKQDALVTGLDQYDYGQVLRIQGLKLPTAVEIHFGLEETGGTTTTRIGVTKDGVTDVPIPDSMLENGDTSLDYTIYAFIYLTDETSGKTVHRIKMQVKARSKPELLNKPEDKELFQKAIEAVNQSAKEAEGWAHGREDMPERATDNAKYYAGESAKSAESVKGVEQNVKDMVTTIGGIEQQVQDVKEYAGQAKTAAENALLSEQEAKKSEEASLQHRTGAETAENNAELAEQNAKKSEQAVEQAKQLVMQMGQQVLQDKNQVAEKVEAFNKVVTDASDAINTQKTESLTEIETAKTSSVGAVETAGTEQTKKVADEGAKQVGAVNTEAQKHLKAMREAVNGIVADRQQITQNKEDVTTLKEDLKGFVPKQQGAENKGKALVVGDDGNVTVGEVQGGDGIPIINDMSSESPLVVPDSAERVNKGFSLIGKSEQVTTTGKNLFDINAIESGADIVIIEDGIEVISNRDYPKAKMNNPHFLMDAMKNSNIKSLVISFKECGDAVSFIRITANVKKGELSFKVDTDTGNVSRPIDITDITEITDITFEVFWKGNSPVIGQGWVKGIQLEFSDKPTPYEPYTGGKPSPSPDYPQEIKNVGKWNEEKQKYEVDVKVTGRNLLNLRNPNVRFDRCILQGDGSIKSDIRSNYYFCSIYVDDPYVVDNIKNDQAITFSIGKGIQSRRITISLHGERAGSVNYQEKNSVSGGNSVSIVPSGFKKVSKIELRFNRSDSLFTDTETVVRDFMIHFGESTTYQSYKEQTLTLTSDRPLTKWDKLVEQDGQIGWLYSTEIITLTGSEEWIRYNDYNAFYTIDYDIVSYSEPYCTHYAYGNITSNIDKCVFTLGAGAYANSLWMRERKINEPLQDFKAYLSDEYKKGEPVTVYYNSKSSQFVPLPQDEQNAIRALSTYYPTTVITTDGGEVNPDVEVTYIADTKNYIDQKIAAIGKTVVETQKALL